MQELLDSLLHPPLYTLIALWAIESRRVLDQLAKGYPGIDVWPQTEL